MKKFQSGHIGWDGPGSDEESLFQKFHAKLANLNYIPCECGCRDNHWDVKDTISGHVCEAEVRCDQCNALVNYWAYGGLESPETYTGRIAQFFEGIEFKWQKWKLSRLAKKTGF